MDINPIYIYNSIITDSVELTAAIFGSFYLKRTKDSRVKPFTVYLWMTFIVEVLAFYAFIVYYFDFDFEWFRKLKNSNFARNSWLFTIRSYIAMVVLAIYYLGIVKSPRARTTIKIMTLIFIGVNLLSTFKVNIRSLELFYTLYELVIVTIFSILYLLQLFKGEDSLRFGRVVHFYIVSGLFVWYLCITPLYLFTDYFYEFNRIYHDFRIITLLVFNVLLYLWFAYGFWLCARKTQR